MIAKGSLLALAAFLASDASRSSLHAILLSPQSVSPERLRSEKTAGTTHIALDLRDPLDAAAVASAAASIRSHGLAVGAWIEVARDPALADAHPEWMASLGAHEDWRVRFPNAPKTAPGFVTKAWPWVPIGSAEAFEHHLKRIAGKLGLLPGGADVVFLSGVQGGPSACGCGNDLCRWAIDYQVPSTAKREWTDATLARFVERAESIVPGGRETPVIAVVATECEENDLPDRPGGCCSGLACYRGLCWPAWTGQIAALARAERGRERRIGVLATASAFARVAGAYEGSGGWAGETARLFREMPPRFGAKGVPVERLVAVVGKEDAEGLAAARKAGFGGVVVAEVPLPQSFEPRAVAVPPR